MYEKLAEHIVFNDKQQEQKLRELLRRIDDMVCRKRDDWQNEYDKMSDALKEKDLRLKEAEEKLATTSTKLSNSELKVAKLESGKSELIRQYEVQAQSLKEKLQLLLARLGTDNL